MRALSVLALCSVFHSVLAGDQPQWGVAWSRNMVSEERGLPASFNLETKQNVRWVVDIGTESHSTPVIAGGRIFVGTNNGQPRDPKHQGDRGVFMCFEEQTGKLLWQLVVPKRDEDPYYDWPRSGISSPGTVEGNRVYIVSNRHEVMCLDVAGLRNGNDGPFNDEAAHMTPKGTNAPAQPLQLGDLDADIIWSFDMMADAGIWPHDGAHTSILIYGEHLYVNTSTGVDNTHRKIRTPDAPSLLVFDKRTGKLLAREDEGIAPNIFHATWSAPALSTIQGKPVIFLAAGNGIIYGFEPLATNTAAAPNGKVSTLKKVWQFDFDPSGPKTEVHRYTSNRGEGPSNIYGLPVIHDGKMFIAGGGDVFWGKNEAWLKAIRLDAFGDVTRTAQFWSYPLEKHVLSTPALYNGMAFIADTSRNIHCVDAATGKPHWVHGADGDFWASPLIADGKMFIGSRRGDFWIFEANREKKLLFNAKFPDPISATPVAANGALYVSTMRKLYALATGSNRL